MGPGRDVDVAMVIVVAGRGGGRWQARLRRLRTPSIIRRCVLDGEEAYPLPSQHPKIQFLNVMSVLNPMYVVSFLI